MAHGPSPTMDGDVLCCPTCGARQKWSHTCRRCRSNLSLLLHVAEAWRRCRRQALTALRDGRVAEARRFARRCQELAPGNRSRRLLAVCCLLEEDWPAALATARPLLAQEAPDTLADS